MLFSRSVMRIGDIQLNPGALLAPMEAVTDLPFRTVCEELGIRWTQSNHRNISISHRDSVAVLERIVGPKA